MTLDKDKLEKTGFRVGNAEDFLATDRIEEIRAKLDNVYLERWQPLDDVPDERWREAYEDIEYLLAEVDRQERRLGLMADSLTADENCD